MTITDVEWSRDIRGRAVLELKLDGHPAYIQSSQQTELTRRGLLNGIVFLTSERSSQVPSDYITGNYAPDYVGLDLVGGVCPVRGDVRGHLRGRVARGPAPDARLIGQDTTTA
jgi:hypothetical protein